MGFWNFFKTKKKDNQDPDDNFISEESSLDLIFAKNFTESGGRFIFLDQHTPNWFSNMLYIVIGSSFGYRFGKQGLQLINKRKQ